MPARERLDWTRLELAAAADVPLWFIQSPIKDSPENRSFFGEGVKVVVEVVVDPQDRSTISTTLETTFVRRRTVRESGGCCCCPVRWGRSGLCR